GQVTIKDVTGNTAINGTWTIINVTPTSFQLKDSKGDGLDAGGGTWSDRFARSVELTLPVGMKTAVADTYRFSVPQYIVRSSDAPIAPGTAGTIPYTLDFSGATQPEKDNALKFSRTVYDLMQSFSLLQDPNALMSKSALLTKYIIGGNVGSFV